MTTDLQRVARAPYRYVPGYGRYGRYEPYPASLFSTPLAGTYPGTVFGPRGGSPKAESFRPYRTVPNRTGTVAAPRTVPAYPPPLGGGTVGTVVPFAVRKGPALVTQLRGPAAAATPRQPPAFAAVAASHTGGAR